MPPNTRQITIPAQIYHELETLARFGESPGDVIKRLMKNEADEPEADHDEERGYLFELVQKGYLSADQDLVVDQPRKGLRHRAKVTSAGKIEIQSGEVFSSPTGAANACLGGSNNGWDKWHVKDTGESLSDLRSKSKKSRR
ncbi:restriction system modified-DNA reader domain-containing protein [Salininema proteolyticum]|uniref:RAMA domain-containing protein n=1 Tax=Salininema proteolyticum TaxID=1607685 RepID=A0ABV8U042_9ACTN